MLYGVFLGTLVVASSYCWPVAWIGFELNSMTFISTAMPNNHSKKGAMIYFVAQTSGSLMLLLGGMLSDFCSFASAFLMAGVVFKMGLMPLHFWVPLVVNNLSRFNLFLLLSWQKLGPLVILMTATLGLTLVSALNAAGGALLMCGVVSLRMLLVFSGLLQVAWVLFTSGSFTFYYIFVYFVILGSAILFSVGRSLQFGWSMLNAGGLPPFSGFFIKLKAMMRIDGMMSFLLLSASGLALSSYLRVLLNSRLNYTNTSPILIFSLFIGVV